MKIEEKKKKKIITLKNKHKYRHMNLPQTIHHTAFILVKTLSGFTICDKSTLNYAFLDIHSNARLLGKQFLGIFIHICFRLKLFLSGNLPSYWFLVVLPILWFSKLNVYPTFIQIKPKQTPKAKSEHVIKKTPK